MSGGGDGSVTRTRISDGGRDNDVRSLGGLQGKLRIVKCVGDMILIMDEDEGILIFCGCPTLWLLPS